MMTIDSHAEYFMARAIRLAKQGLYTTDPNPRVGCVLTKNGEIIGEGAHLRAGEAHAEINALAMAGDKAKDATAYVTLEPCSHQGKTPPCVLALLQAGVKKVVAAMEDPNPKVAGRGLQQLRQAGVDVEVGLLAKEAAALNPGFIKRMTVGKPWVRVKLAASLDGRTAMASGESAWITGESARRDVQFLRARASAILTGSGTVLQDNPSLNMRLTADELSINGKVRQPLRVVVDSFLRTPVDAKIYRIEGSVLVYCVDNKSNKNKFISDKVNITYISNVGNKVCLASLLDDLAKREINELHVEAGPTLCGALLSQSLVDEIVLYTATHVIGNTGKSLFHIPEIRTMQERIPMHLQEVRQIGDDLRLTLRTKKQ